MCCNVCVCFEYDFFSSFCFEFCFKTSIQKIKYTKNTNFTSLWHGDNSPTEQSSQRLIINKLKKRIAEYTVVDTKTSSAPSAASSSLSSLSVKAIINAMTPKLETTTSFYIILYHSLLSKKKFVFVSVAKFTKDLQQNSVDKLRG